MIVVYNNFKKKSHEICVAFFHILVYVVILIIVEKKNLQLYPKKNLLLFREDFFVGLLGQIPQHLSKLQITSKTPINKGALKHYYFPTPQKTLENFIL